MAQEVTYADLRFARTPQQEETSGSEGELGGEGELTYENVEGSRAPKEEALPRTTQGVKGPNLQIRHIALGLLGACLFLLATTVGLGVRYWQVSRQLQRASRDHADQSSGLARQISTQEESLAQMEGRLRQTERELNSTRLALGKSQAEAGSTRRRLQEVEEQLRGAQDRLGALRREKEAAKAELERATSCQQIGCCPQGWTLFRWKCLWISDREMTWWKSKEACQEASSRLLILKEPWAPAELWEAVVAPREGQNFPYSEEFWIGLNVTQGEAGPAFLWVDGSVYEGSRQFYRPYYGNYIKLSNGVLEQNYRSYPHHRYICERAASRMPPSQGPGPGPD